MCVIWKNSNDALSSVASHPRGYNPHIGIRFAVDHVDLPADRSSVGWPVTRKTVPSGFSFFFNIHYLRLKVDFLPVLCPGDNKRPWAARFAQSNNLHVDGDGFVRSQP